MGNHGSNLDDILAEDMHHWYNKFMRESPSGLITLFELKAILGLKGMSENANSYVEQVFFTFDMDGVRSHTLTQLFKIKVLKYTLNILREQQVCFMCAGLNGPEPVQKHLQTM